MPGPKQYGDVKADIATTRAPVPAGVGNAVAETSEGFPIPTTGRMIVVFEPGGAKDGLKVLKDKAGLSDVASISSYSRSVFDLAEVAQTQVLHLDRLGVAIVQADPDQQGAIAGLASAMATVSGLASSTPSVRRVFAERYVKLANDGGRPGMPSRDYLDGWIDALKNVRDRFYPGEPGGPGPKERAEQADLSSQHCFQDIPDATWGMQAMGVPTSPWTGLGVKVAILDTGFDLDHPDFQGRTIVAESFSIAGSNGQDIHHHGTHCTGTACGFRGLNGRRYGIAHECDIYVGQVFAPGSSGPTSRDGDIIAGIEWAIAKGCQIVSMSLERIPPVGVNDDFNQDYEDVAARALASGTLVFAAGGNYSSRPGLIRPVNQPANSPSIVAVGSLNSCLGISTFSPRALNLNGGRVDFVGPGEAIISSAPMPVRYMIDSGTSMATPHVAGIAALISHANGGIGGIALWNKLAQTARGFGLDAGDVGFGMPIAPQQ